MLSAASLSFCLLCYLLVLIAEFLRTYRQSTASKNAFSLVVMAIGLLTHTYFLASELFGSQSERLLSDWFQWLSLGAWGLAATCTLLIARHRNSTISLFLIPLIFLLVGIAATLKGSQPFAFENAATWWGRIHGVSLLLGTMFVCQGLAFGVMYLLQSLRLKSKRKSQFRLKLPALEFLRTMNRMNMFAAAATLGAGMLSGILLNVSRDGRIAWFSTGIVVSIALFVWVSIAAVLEYWSKGSLGGRRSAYLSIANFVFTAIVLLLVLLASHGQKSEARRASFEVWTERLG